MASDEEDLHQFVQELTSIQEKLMLFIRGLTGDPHSAADIRQAVNMILWRKKGRFIMGTNFQAWAFRIAQIEVKAYFRKNKKEKISLFGPELMDLMTEELPQITDELPERKLALRDCLAELTRRDQELIHHRYWSGDALNALAAKRNRSVGTLKARLHQVRGLLHRCLDRKLSPPSTAD